MRKRCILLPVLFLLIGSLASQAQTGELRPAEAVAAPSVTVFKLGLNPGRLLRSNRYYGGLVVPLSVGAEHLLNTKISLYTQLDADLGFYRFSTPGSETHAYIPTGALGIGARYYYNQAGRALHNRAHGPFNGNYLALELHTEARHFAFTPTTSYTPSLNALWGMQRRLGSHFLLDLNAGLGLGRSPFLNNYYPSQTTITTQFNLGIYFGR